MSQTTAPRPWSVRLALAAAGLLGAAVASAPADVVILKDGFVIQGTVKKEFEQFFDKRSGQSIPLPKANGFDFLDDGPRVIIFSSHHKQLGEINKSIKLRPDYRVFRTNFARRSDHGLPAITSARGAPPDFNDKWKRTFEVNVAPSGFDRIEQQVVYLDPYTCFVASTTHLWSLAFRTSEMDPYKVRQLLYTHPELAEPDGKCDPIRRVAIIQFFIHAGWLQLAKEEVDRLKKDHPGAMPKDAQEQYDQVSKALDQATAELVVDEAEMALNAGRYRYAGNLLAAFPEKLADQDTTASFAKLNAQHKSAMTRYADGRRLLRKLIDDTTGAAAPRAGIAGGGGPAVAVWPVGKLNPKTASLAAAAEVVYAELHPDSAHRIESFVQLADTAERERAAGREPPKKPEELLATAVSGWAKGRGGATPEVGRALQAWSAREMVLAVQRAPDRNARLALIAKYRNTPSPIGLDEMVQVISLLPPAEPENLNARTGTLLSEQDGTPPDTYKRHAQGTPDNPAGFDYLIKLPPEYHHGRAYPVLIALNTAGMDPGVVMRALARETERHGYILVAPLLWTGEFDKGWQWKGEDHDRVTGVLRDVIRHFTVDNDRVFLFGAADGANMAFDIGLSHPDLFAGVAMMSPSNPRWIGTGMQYWPNAQKLPFYVVTGALAGQPNTDIRRTFGEWMPKGFPGIHVIYKGRGPEWFPAETPVIFDWMNRKKRPQGTATLALGNQIRYDWHIMRTGDNRFYWLGADRISPSNLMEGKALANIVPAGLQGDLQGNRLILRTRGVRTVTVWLSRDMIDWTKPVSVQLNGQAAYGWKPKVLQPDIEVLLDDYAARGDRRMLFLEKLEFNSGN